MLFIFRLACKHEVESEVESEKSISEFLMLFCPACNRNRHARFYRRANAYERAST
jgi:hypothetical protein